MHNHETSIEIDADGRLFDPRLRSHMGSSELADTVAREALAAMRAATHAFRVSMDRWLDRHGLSEGRMGVLWMLKRSGPTSLSDLASALDVSPRNITGLVDHLERDGLVERVPDPEDRRSVRANLTEAGRTRIESIWKEGLEHQHEIANGLTKEDLAQLRHLCLQLVENARKELGK